MILQYHGMVTINKLGLKKKKTYFDVKNVTLRELIFI